MPKNDLNKIKQFIRVAHDIENALSVSLLQKKILLKLVSLHQELQVPTSIGDFSTSINGTSSRSVLRHIDTLKEMGWIHIEQASHDQRVKYVKPTPRLIRTLSKKLALL
jgi:DNA-binding MarR family transcriptional regulator